MSYFTYNGYDSRDYGILSYSPMPSAALEITEEQELIGRHENFTSHTGRYENIQLTFEIGFKDRQKVRNLYTILQGTGDLILSERPNEVYKVKSIAITPERLSVRFGKATIEFTCSPFAYFAEPTIMEINTLNSVVGIDNNGTIFSEPLMQFKLDSDKAEINVNGSGIVVEKPKGYADGDTIVVDCAEELAYYVNSDGKTVSCLQNTYGDFPLFHTGTNYMIVNGVKDFIVNARERYI